MWEHNQMKALPKEIGSDKKKNASLSPMQIPTAKTLQKMMLQ